MTSSATAGSRAAVELFCAHLCVHSLSGYLVQAISRGRQSHLVVSDEDSDGCKKLHALVLSGVQEAAYQQKTASSCWASYLDTR
jgi:hypothetical protein